MSNDTEFPVTLFLSKEKISLMPRDELSAFLQVLRIDNAIRTPMKLHLKLQDNPDAVENTKDKIDLLRQIEPHPVSRTAFKLSLATAAGASSLS